MGVGGKAWGLREAGHGVFGRLGMLLFSSAMVLGIFCISQIYPVKARTIPILQT
jgi:hypothetical protein